MLSFPCLDYWIMAVKCPHLWNNYYFCFPHLSHIYPGMECLSWWGGWERTLGQKRLCGVLGVFCVLTGWWLLSCIQLSKLSRYLRSEITVEWSIKIETIKKESNTIVGLKSQTAEVKNPHHTCLTMQLTSRRKDLWAWRQDRRTQDRQPLKCSLPKEAPVPGLSFS